MDRLRRLLPSGALLLLLIAQLTGCAHRHADSRPEAASPTLPAERPTRPVPAAPTARQAATPDFFEGIASYYGRFHAGRLTASGVPFRPEALTCAHRSLRFGTRLRVTNLENGKTTQVVVNDRGPYIRGRVLDVSLGAARKLAMVRRGKARVRVHILP